MLSSFICSSAILLYIQYEQGAVNRDGKNKMGMKLKMGMETKTEIEWKERIFISIMEQKFQDSYRERKY